MLLHLLCSDLSRVWQRDCLGAFSKPVTKDLLLARNLCLQLCSLLCLGHGNAFGLGIDEVLHGDLFGIDLVGEVKIKVVKGDIGDIEVEVAQTVDVSNGFAALEGWRGHRDVVLSK